MLGYRMPSVISRKRRERSVTYTITSLTPLAWTCSPTPSPCSSSSWWSVTPRTVSVPPEPCQYPPEPCQYPPTNHDITHSTFKIWLIWPLLSLLFTNLLIYWPAVDCRFIDRHIFYHSVTCNDSAFILNRVRLRNVCLSVKSSAATVTMDFWEMFEQHRKQLW